MTTRANLKKAATLTATDDEPKVVTPKRDAPTAPEAPKTKRRVNHKHFFFNMGDDIEDAFFENAKDAATHREDFKGLIVQEKAWSRRKDFLVFKKQHLNPILNPPQPAPPQASGTNDSVLAEQLVAAMNNDKNCDRIEACYKVTSSSDKCALIIRFISQHGTDSWVFKPDMLAEVFNKWTEVMEVSCTLLFEALANMQSGKASDPDSSDKNTPLVTI